MRSSLLFVLSGILWVSTAAADQVTLKNGDRLTGTIVSGDGKTLLLKSEYAGDVTIKWDAITAIDSSQNLNLTLKDGKRLAGKVSTTDGTLVVGPSAAPAGAGSAAKDAITAVRNDAEQKSFDEQAEKLAHPKMWYFWSGILDTGLALTRGNSATASYTLNGKAVRETARDKITLYGTYVFASDDTTTPSRTTANSIISGIRGDLNISARTFVFGTADFETNQLQHLDLRQVYGGGFGYHVLKTDRATLDAFGGLNYDKDEFGAYSLANPTPPPATIELPSHILNSAEAVIGEEFDGKFTKRNTFAERFSVFPNLSHTGEYRFQFDSTLASQLKNWLSWQFTFSDHYISYPPTGLKGNDIILSTGLRVSLGKPAKF
jgi:putative salt-induced outer membrane protein YdiY